MTSTIRLARTLADYAVFHALLVRYNEFLQKHGYTPVPATELEESPAALAHRYVAAFVASQNSMPVGAIALRHLDSATAELRRLYVIDEGRRAGIGTQLIERALQSAHTHGYQRVVLGTTADHQAAVALYRKLRFKEISRFVGADEEDRLFMEWLL